MEIERGGLSYTVDTLEALTARHPGSELVLLLGSDALKGFPQWKNPARIRELARVAVLCRAGVTGAPVGGPANNVAGGMAAWAEAGLTVVRDDGAAGTVA